MIPDSKIHAVSEFEFRHIALHDNMKLFSKFFA